MNFAERRFVEPKRATIWWDDAWRSEEHYTLKEVEEAHKPMRLGTTGWVIKEDETGIMLAKTVAPAGLNEHVNPNPCRDMDFIPRSCVVKVEYLVATDG